MLLPVVAETYDGFLSSQSRFPVTPAHVVRGIKEASSDRVPEGNTGGGTGMICHRFKGGTGSSSRVITGFDIDGKPKSYTIGVLVQANYGSTKNLHIGGVPVGGLLLDEQAAAVESSGKEARKDGSIIVVIATDVPLIPVQLQRVAKRAAIGLAKVGGYGSNSSGDIFLAFSTGNKVPGEKFAFGKGSPYQPAPQDARVIDTGTIDGVFEAAADATEEAIYNALFMAETVTGFQGRTVEALNLAKVKEMVERRL
ncbi:peptidase family S58-domain-containing protein [Stachybotrys elegans]|uniref:Peptidase family S58-domain-containing protein n=1 Tax=Stachybotrys elegans TaxID=80388 RepID=A0A8K0SM32_9HYPO|nr:peptidase family S58-domain-containing protein [Stachybotrys elegans]